MATFGILCCAIEQRRDSHGRVIVYTLATKYSHIRGSTRSGLRFHPCAGTFWHCARAN